MLLFKKKFLEAIRAGRKTQTIRVWKHRMMRSGQRSYIPGAGYIHVASVDEVDLARLTDADALPDGFDSAHALRSELTTLYAAQLAAGQRVYRVCFTVLSPQEQEAAAANRRAAKASATA